VIHQKEGYKVSKVQDLTQTADWKSEKHVPVIDCPDVVSADEIFDVRISLGKEIAHPNTTEHHIRWIQLFFKPEGGKFAYQIGNFGFTAHGESVDGPNTGPVYTHHSVTTAMKTSKAGELVALSLCNIHGLWEYSKEIKLT
jgi:superoxide reductase